MTVPPNDPNAQDDIIKRLTSVESGQSQQTALTKLLTNPNVRAILEAEQRGENVRVVAGAVENAPEVDFEEMTPRDVTKYILGLVPKMIAPEIAKVQRETNEQLSGIVTYLQGQARDSYRSEADTLRTQIDDFDAYVPDIKELAKTNQGLTIKELYQIAKSRRTESTPPPTAEEAAKAEAEAKAKAEAEGKEDEGKDTSTSASIDSEKPATGGAAPKPKVETQDINTGLSDWRTALGKAAEESVEGLDIGES